MAKVRNPFTKWVSDRRKSPGYWKAAIKVRAASDLDRLLMDSGKTRATLADEVGRSRSYITQVLKGTKNLTIDTMCDFAAIFGMVPRIEFVRPEYFWSTAFYIDTCFKSVVPLKREKIEYQDGNSSEIDTLGADWFSSEIDESSCSLENIA